MIYAQIKSGNKLHLAFEAGEGWSRDSLVQAGYFSAPICNEATFDGHYRMTCNLPLSHACKNCLRVYNARTS